MKRHPDIEKELRDISTVVADLNRNNLFQVPSDYFRRLPEQVLSRVQSDYADEKLSANEEINSLSPLVAGLKQQPSLSVPANFFDDLPQIIINKISNEETKAPVIRLNPDGTKKRTYYLAAASVIGVILISSLLLLFNNSSQKQPAVAQNDDTPQNISTRLPGIADSALADYLTNAPETSGWVLDNTDTDIEQTAFFTLNDNNFSEMMKDIPDETLSNYEQEVYGKFAL